MYRPLPLLYLPRKDGENLIAPRCSSMSAETALSCVLLSSSDRKTGILTKMSGLKSMSVLSRPMRWW